MVGVRRVLCEALILGEHNRFWPGCDDPVRESQDACAGFISQMWRGRAAAAQQLRGMPMQAGVADSDSHLSRCLRCYHQEISHHPAMMSNLAS
jgi:hypothetical protein